MQKKLNLTKFNCQRLYLPIMLVALSFLVNINNMLYAQLREPGISFNETRHNFGQFNEDAGVVTHRFEFTNTGGEPLIINNVTSSCGCTTPSWSNQPILPGEKGYIDASYNPKNRPGTFTKSISVQSNASDTLVVLLVTGEVLPHIKTQSEIYMVPKGDITVTSKQISFSTVYVGQQKIVTLGVLNSSDHPVEIGFIDVPEFISLECVPLSLEPGATGVIKATFDAAKVNDWGNYNQWITLSYNKIRTNEMLVITANIAEDFSILTPQQLADAPIVGFDSTSFNFGVITQGDTINHTFKILNTGKSDLIIRKVNSSCGCTVAKPTKDIIPPGMSTDLKVHFDSQGKSGTITKSITVITNDPKHPSSTLYIQGNINLKP
jgi:hypothetical protein